MTVQHDTRMPPVEQADTSRSEQVASTAAHEAEHVASSAVEGARDVAGEVTSQAKVVAGQARQELDGLVTRTRDEVREQAEQRSAQAASGLRTLSEQLLALADGRPESAGPLVGYLRDAQDQVRHLAARLEGGGPHGMVEDVTRFARRRPGVFLAGAVGAGFVVGRLVRAGVASQQERPTEPMSSAGWPALGSTVPIDMGDAPPFGGNGPVVTEAPLPPPAPPETDPWI